MPAGGRGGQHFLYPLLLPLHRFGPLVAGYFTFFFGDDYTDGPAIVGEVTPATAQCVATFTDGGIAQQTAIKVCDCTQAELANRGLPMRNAIGAEPGDLHDATRSCAQLYDVDFAG